MSDRPPLRGCASAFGEVFESLAATLRTRMDREHQNPNQVSETTQSTTSALSTLCAAVETRLSPTGQRILGEICAAHERGDLASRQQLAEALAVAPGTILKRIRDVRLVVRSEGYHLITVRGKGYSLEKTTL